MTTTLRTATLTACLGLALLIWTTPALSQDRIDHFPSQTPETMEQAVAFFNDYNQRLASLLSQEELSLRDLATIHEWTYTLENSLEYLRDQLARLADSLEDLHVASETADIAGTQAQGQRYLMQAARWPFSHDSAL